MKSILTLCAVILVVGGVLLYRNTRLPDRFGEFSSAPAAKVSDLIARPKDFTKKTVSIDGIVREQCTSMGCYFFFREGEKTLRIDMQEVAMNAPRKEGHHVRVEGRMVPYGDGFQFYASAVSFE